MVGTTEWGHTFFCFDATSQNTRKLVSPVPLSEREPIVTPGCNVTEKTRGGVL